MALTLDFPGLPESHRKLSSGPSWVIGGEPPLPGLHRGLALAWAVPGGNAGDGFGSQSGDSGSSPPWRLAHPPFQAPG